VTIAGSSTKLGEVDKTRAESTKGAAIALLPWGNVLEDFLDTIGVSFETFCDKFTGSWMFGYVSALRHIGVRTVLICTSSRVTRPQRLSHAPTGATVYLLPAPRMYRALRRVATVVPPLRHLASYLSTPPAQIARTLKREGCVAVLCQEYEYPRFDVCVLLGRWLHIPVFATFQGGDYQRSRLERHVRPHALRASAGLIIAARTERQRVHANYQIAPSKISAIFNPIDLQIWKVTDRRAARAALRLPPDALVVGWHGRVSIRQKGLDVLLDAWERICRRHEGRDLRLLLVGTGKDAARLHQLVAASREHNIIWLDQFVHDQSAVQRHLAAVDVYAFPSRHEGCPVSLLEAMGCGLPVVAADASCVPDILQGGDASGGVIVQRENAEQLAQELSRLLDQADYRKMLGVRARLRAESCFGFDVVGRQLRDVLVNAAQCPPS
jgi:glycosyltransferase involved in cell wall biosynthesis